MLLTGGLLSEDNAACKKNWKSEDSRAPFVKGYPYLNYSFLRCLLSVKSIMVGKIQVEKFGFLHSLLRCHVTEARHEPQLFHGNTR